MVRSECAPIFRVNTAIDIVGIKPLKPKYNAGNGLNSVGVIKSSHSEPSL